MRRLLVRVIKVIIRETYETDKLCLQKVDLKCTHYRGKEHICPILKQVEREIRRDLVIRGKGLGGVIRKRKIKGRKVKGKKEIIQRGKNQRNGRRKEKEKGRKK